MNNKKEETVVLVYCCRRCAMSFYGPIVSVGNAEYFCQNLYVDGSQSVKYATHDCSAPTDGRPVSKGLGDLVGYESCVEEEEKP